MGAGLVQAGEATVHGRVLDAGNQPVAEAEVSTGWLLDASGGKAHKSVTTDAEGAFTLSVWPGKALFAMDKERARGGIVAPIENKLPEPLELALAPLVEIQGECAVEGTAEPPKLCVLVSRQPEGAPLGSISATSGRFSTKLPPGAYRLSFMGFDFKPETRDVSLAPGKPADLKKTVLQPSVGSQQGRLPPPLEITDARGAGKDVKLADFKGKWVLLEFWGYS